MSYVYPIWSVYVFVDYDLRLMPGGNISLKALPEALQIVFFECCDLTKCGRLTIFVSALPKCRQEISLFNKMQGEQQGFQAGTALAYS